MNNVITDAERALREGDFREAEELSQNILHQHPGKLHVLRILGYALLGQNKFESALGVFRQALEFENKKARGLAACAEVLLKMDQRDDAQRYFREASILLGSQEVHDLKDFRVWIEVEKKLGARGKVGKLIEKALTAFPDQKKESLVWLQEAFRLSVSTKITSPAVQNYLEAYPEADSLRIAWIQHLISVEQAEEALKEICLFEERSGGNEEIVKRLRTNALVCKLTQADHSPCEESLESLLLDLQLLVEESPEYLQGYIGISKVIGVLAETRREGKKGSEGLYQLREEILLLGLSKAKKEKDSKISAALVDLLIEQEDLKRAKGYLSFALEKHPSAIPLLRIALRFAKEEGNSEKERYYSLQILKDFPKDREALLAFSRYHLKNGDILNAYNTLLYGCRILAKDLDIVCHTCQVELALGLYKRVRDRIVARFGKRKLTEYPAGVQDVFQNLLIVETFGKQVKNSPSDAVTQKIEAFVMGESSCESGERLDVFDDSSVRPTHVSLMSVEELRSPQRFKKYDLVALASSDVKCNSMGLREMQYAMNDGIGYVRGLPRGLFREDITERQSGVQGLLLLRGKDLSEVEADTFDNLFRYFESRYVGRTILDVCRTKKD